MKKTFSILISLFYLDHGYGYKFHHEGVVSHHHCEFTIGSNHFYPVAAQKLELLLTKFSQRTSPQSVEMETKAEPKTMAGCYFIVSLSSCKKEVIVNVLG